jgi:hypothetical protein
MRSELCAKPLVGQVTWPTRSPSPVSFIRAEAAGKMPATCVVGNAQCLRVDQVKRACDWYALNLPPMGTTHHVLPELSRCEHGLDVREQSFSFESPGGATLHVRGFEESRIHGLHVCKHKTGMLGAATLIMSSILPLLISVSMSHHCGSWEHRLYQPD